VHNGRFIQTMAGVPYLVRAEQLITKPFKVLVQDCLKGFNPQLPEKWIANQQGLAGDCLPLRCALFFCLAVVHFDVKSQIALPRSYAAIQLHSYTATSHTALAVPPLYLCVADVQRCGRTPSAERLVYRHAIWSGVQTCHMVWCTDMPYGLVYRHAIRAGVQTCHTGWCTDMPYGLVYRHAIRAGVRSSTREHQTDAEVG
jgi:sRNA-binding regulator protein Hfq